MTYDFRRTGVSNPISAIPYNQQQQPPYQKGPIQGIGDPVNQPMNQIQTMLGGGTDNYAPTMSEYGQPPVGGPSPMPPQPSPYGTTGQPAPYPMAGQPPAATATTATGGPSYGLAGSEDTLQNTMKGVLEMLNLGNVQGVDQITGANQELMKMIAQARGMNANNSSGALSLLGNAAQGAQADTAMALKQLEEARVRSSAAFGDGMAGLDAAGSGGREAINTSIDAAQKYFNPYQAGGVEAQQMQAALSGAMGPEAQKKAMDSTMNSPEFEFLREQGLREVGSAAAKSGGLGGGEYMRDLTRFGQGLASQRFDTAYNRLGGLAERGIGVASAQAGLEGQRGTSIADLLGRMAQSKASLAGQAGSTEASMGQSGASMLMDKSRLQSQLAGQGADVLGRESQLDMSAVGQMSDLISRGSISAADLLSGNYRAGAQAIGNIGQQMAGDKIAAGNQISSNYGQSANQMAMLQNALGQQYGSEIGKYKDDLVRMLMGLGSDESGQSMNMAQLLAQLTTGAGAQNAQFTQQVGQAQAGGTVGASNQATQTAQSALMAFLAFSDRRLKTDIEKVFEIDGLNVYEWSWNRISGLAGKGFGFMSDEVRKLFPRAVVAGNDGYDRVNYLEVLNGTAS